jgi:hypothetical protein
MNIVVLAALIIKGWPSSGALGLIVGVNLFSTGLAVIILALAGRPWCRRLPRLLNGNSC